MWNPPDPYEPTSEPYRLTPPRRRSELREALDAATGQDAGGAASDAGPIFSGTPAGRKGTRKWKPFVPFLGGVIANALGTILAAASLGRHRDPVGALPPCRTSASAPAPARGHSHSPDGSQARQVASTPAPAPAPPPASEASRRGKPRWPPRPGRCRWRRPWRTRGALPPAYGGGARRRSGWSCRPTPMGGHGDADRADGPPLVVPMSLARRGRGEGGTGLVSRAVIVVHG